MGRGKNFFAAMGVLLGVAVAAEVAMRLFYPAAQANTPRVREILDQQAAATISHFVPHPELGALLAPLQSLEIDTPDFRYTFRTDHAGFPNLDPWPEKVDVAVLGNSLITGAGVGYEGQFTTLLQQELSGRTVLNFGLPGGGTEHQLRTYRMLVAPLRPSVVVATLWMTWEIDNSLKFAAWLQQDPRPDFTEYRMNYRASKPPKAKKRDSGLRPLLRKIVDGSRLLSMMKRRARSLRNIREPVELVMLENGRVVYLSSRDEERLMSAWNRPDMPDIRRTFFEPLETLRAEVEANGGKFLVALFPSKEELYAAAEWPELLTLIQETRDELLARGLDTLDLYPDFQAVAGSNPPFYSADMHLDASGHQLAASALARSIAQRGVFSPPP